MIVTSGGDKIPSVAQFYATSRVQNYAQVARIDVPEPWMDEFVQNPGGFRFISSDGECFTQIHVLDELGPVDEEEWHEGRIYLLREYVVPFSVAAASLMAARPASMPHYAGE